jgi:signal recognition particle subunit SEC65
MTPQADVDDWDLSIAPIQIKIYPLYFNSEKSWSQGRRVPSHISCKNPNIISLTETIGRLGLAFKVEPNARHPKDPFTFGRLLVQSTTSKKALLRQIASSWVSQIPDSLQTQASLSLSSWSTIISDR